jgi:hypothetical protein
MADASENGEMSGARRYGENAPNDDGLRQKSMPRPAHEIRVAPEIGFVGLVCDKFWQ